MERVEDRVLMAVFVVNNTSDTANATSGDGSLRGEIIASNATTTPNTITFSLPTGLQTINLTSPLPPITDSLVIDGSTQAGFSGTPLIQIKGSTSATGTGIVINAAASGLTDLIIDNFNGDGVDLNGGTGFVDGCYIGVDPTGAQIVANTGVGILVASSGNTIGATTTNVNVISGNNTGIQVNGSNGSRNEIVHSYIGTDATGDVALGNLGTGLGSGIELDGGNNTIGGSSLNGPQGSGNAISGNDDGILISGTAATGNVVMGNYIGTNAAGTAALDNNVGIFIQGAPRSMIGGVSSGSANVIDSTTASVYISGSASSGNRVQGNLIGVAANGTTALGAGTTGVVLNGASGNLVGGDTLVGNASQYGNVIANTGGNGVSVIGATGDGILSNLIYNVGQKTPSGLGISLNSSNLGVKPPTLTSAESGAGETRVAGSYVGNPNTQYRIQFFYSAEPNVNGFGDGQNFLGDLDILTNSQGVFNFTDTLQSTAPVGDILSATATQNVLVLNNTSQFAQNVAVTQAPVTDLAVSTSIPSTGPFISQPYTYTLTVTNNGPNDATGVILTDTIPTNSTFLASQSTPGLTITGGVVTDDIGNLPNGMSETVLIVVNPKAVGPFTNTATVTGDDLDPLTDNNVSIESGTAVPDADLSVLLIPNVTLSPLGSAITYTLAVNNTGPSVATGTTVTVQFPADFTNLIVQPSQGSYTINPDNSVTIKLGIVPASSASIITMSGTPSVTQSAVVTAGVQSPVADPNTGNNTTSATVVVANAADLGVSISAAPSPALVGQDLIYSVVVNNNGPSAASEPVLADLLPAGVTFDPANSSAGPNGTLSFVNGVVTASLNALLPGDSDTVTIAVIPSVSGQLTNTVSVGDPDEVNPVEIDPDLTNNVASAIVAVSPADLQVSVINPTDPLFLGQNAVYQILVTNNGPSTATNVLLSDAFAGGGTIVATSAGSFQGPNYAANLGSLPSGQSFTITIVVDPTISGSLVNEAAVSSDQFDTDPSNNTSSSTNLVSPVDLSVVVSGPTAPILLGQPLTFTVTVTNAGPAAATNVLFSDALPSAAILTGFTATQGAFSANSTYTFVNGNIGTLAAGASATMQITLLPFFTGVASNTTAVGSDDFDTNAANNSASSSVPVINLPGVIQNAVPIQAVAEDAGFVNVTFDRLYGTLGTVTANYSTQDYTGLAGVNYVASAGTVTFLPGQTTATITIPVLDDRRVDGNNAFFVVLSNPTGGASLGSQAVSQVVVVNTDRDTVPPAITSLLALPNGNSITGFALTFDKAMDPTRATLLSNYYVFLSGSGAVNSGTQVPLAAAEYNASNNTVILVPTAPLPSNRFYEVVANGASSTALTDTSGNVLYGSNGPNTNYVAYYGQGTKLTYDDAQNNVVTLNLSGGGIMGVYRASNGNAALIDLYGIVPHSTRLSGSVKKLNKSGSGHTYIGAINGFGQFGSVRSSLTTPGFYVGSSPVSAASVGPVVQVPLAVTAESSTATTVTPKKATPKGPHHAKR